MLYKFVTSFQIVSVRDFKLRQMFDSLCEDPNLFIEKS